MKLPVARMINALAPSHRVVRNQFYCPLCGFPLHADLDGHFVPCLVGRIAEVWFSAPRQSRR